MTAGRRRALETNRVNPNEYIPASNDTLAEEARLWDSGVLRPSDWFDAPDGVPRSAERATVGIRISKRTLAVLEAFARREGVGCGALANRWLDERIVKERDDLDRAARAEPPAPPPNPQP